MEKSFNIVYFVAYPDNIAKRCLEVLEYQSKIIIESGILNDNRCKNMFIVFTYDNNSPEPFLKNLYNNHSKIIYENFDISSINIASCAEYPGIQKVYNLSIEQPESYIHYFHSKGITHKKDVVEDWTDYLHYWNTTNYRLNLEKLDENYAASGVDFLYGLRCCPMHYSGNFWWVNPLYMKNISEIPKLGSKRHDYEFYLVSNLKKLNHKCISLFQSSGTNHGRPGNGFQGFFTPGRSKFTKDKYDINNCINLIF